MTSLQPSTGDIIAGKYRIERLIGRGGMGSVYLAEHLALSKPVALKVMGDALRADEQYVRRFEREAKATYALEHRNIVRVYDYGREPAPYLVMEWIDGETLKASLNRLEVPPRLDWVSTIMEQLFRALEAAHASGIVHRDLKPENILLKYDGPSNPEPIVKVVDFGMARVAAVVESEPTLTQLDFVAGTPAYMSPEQCRSLVVGPASDLYSAGCILTELLQLTPPFSTGSPVELMSQQMFAPPPALNRPASAPPVPVGVERLRRALLAKHLHQRPSSATAALHALSEALDAAPAQPRGTAEDGSTRGAYRSEPPVLAEAPALVYYLQDPDASPVITESERLAWSALGAAVRPWPLSSREDSLRRSLLFIPCRETNAASLARVTDAIKDAVREGAAPVVVSRATPAAILPVWIEAGVSAVVEHAEPTAVGAVLRRLSRAREPSSPDDLGGPPEAS